MNSPVFILGIQRSGTTLLRLLLNSHSKIDIPPEADFWVPFVDKYGRDPSRSLLEKEKRRILSRIEKHRYFSEWRVSIDDFVEDYGDMNTASTFAEFMCSFYTFHANNNNKVIWGDKTPPFCRYVRELVSIFPMGKFIHIVRDGRDQYTSRKTYSVNSARQSANNVSVAALEWNYKISKVTNGLIHVNARNSLEVRYEDLVAKTESTLIQVCKFLSVDYECEMHKFWETSSEHVSHGHSDLIFRPVSAESVCKWRSNLTSFEQRKFEAISRKILIKYNYQVLNETFDLIAYAGVILDLLIGLPQRIYYKGVATFRVHRRVTR